MRGGACKMREALSMHVGRSPESCLQAEGAAIVLRFLNDFNVLRDANLICRPLLGSSAPRGALRAYSRPSFISQGAFGLCGLGRLTNVAGPHCRAPGA